MTRLYSATAFLLLSGCTTFVAGERATPLSEGIEYSLPVPIIRVTPQANGTMDVKVEYLPDPDNTYVLRTESVVSAYTLDVQRENGMLKSVSLDSKSDAVAAAVAESAGRLIDLRAAAAVKEEEAAAAAAKEEAKALSDAGLAVTIAQARFDTLTQANAGPDKLLEAQLALDEAKAKRNHLLSSANGGQSSAFNSPVGTQGPMAAAPVLFRVVPDVATGGVKLVAFEGERFLPTSTAASPAPAAPAPLSVTLEGPGVLTTTAGQPYKLQLNVNRPALRLDMSATKLVSVSGQDRSSFLLTSNVNTAQTGVIIFVTLKADTPPGNYLLTPVVRLPHPNDPEGQPAEGAPIMIVIT